MKFYIFQLYRARNVRLPDHLILFRVLRHRIIPRIRSNSISDDLFQVVSISNVLLVMEFMFFNFTHVCHLFAKV